MTLTGNKISRLNGTKPMKKKLLLNKYVEKNGHQIPKLQVRSPTVSRTTFPFTPLILAIDSQKSKASQKSYQSRVSEAKEREAAEKPEWN